MYNLYLICGACNRINGQRGAAYQLTRGQQLKLRIPRCSDYTEVGFVSATCADPAMPMAY